MESCGPCGLGVPRRQWNWGGGPERGLFWYQALAGLRLSSRSDRNSLHLVLRASSESRLTSPHASRYKSWFDCTVRLKILRSFMASRRAGFDHGLVPIPQPLPRKLANYYLWCFSGPVVSERGRMGLGRTSKNALSHFVEPWVSPQLVFYGLRILFAKKARGSWAGSLIGIW